jgi:GTPase SAR1 family protein
MEKENTLLINKYQPLYFNDFEIEDEIIDILNTFIKMDCLNIMFTGNMGSGKTSLLNALIREYYKGYDNYTDNILYINSLKEQGINYYRNDVKTFCQTCSTIKNKKKIIVLDDLDFINEQSQQVFRNCIDKFSHNVHFISSSFVCNLFEFHQILSFEQAKEYLLNLKNNDIDKFREINRLKSQRYRDNHKNDEEYKIKCREYQKNIRNKKKLEFLYHENIIKNSNNTENIS